MDFSGGSVLKNLPADVGDISSIPGKEYPLEKDPTGNPPSSLAWEIPWTEESGWL